MKTRAPDEDKEHKRGRGSERSGNGNGERERDAQFRASLCGQTATEVRGINTRNVG
jgi:hypothetical protein